MKNNFINNIDGTTLIFLNNNFALIDTCKHRFIRRYHWISCKQPKGRWQIYAHVNRTKNIQMARFIFGEAGKLQVGHINNNPFDNRKSNLFLETTSFHQRKATWITNTSGHKNVYFDKRDKVFIAQKNIKGKHVVICRSKYLNVAVKAVLKRRL